MSSFTSLYGVKNDSVIRTDDFSNLFTPLDQAVMEITARRKDTGLIKKVSEYLQNDVPKHFSGPEPIIYLSRHIATPNYESLRFIKVAQKFSLPIAIGEDKQGLFVSINEEKRALGKMPVVKGMNRFQDEIIENFTVIDFKKCDGDKFVNIETTFGIPLINWHHKLFNEIYPTGINIIDESLWIDRNHRGNLLEQYKHLLALMVVSGILCESFYKSDQPFVEQILKPAFDYVTNEFGYKPLIYQLIDIHIDQLRDMVSYPSVLYSFINQQF